MFHRHPHPSYLNTAQAGESLKPVCAAEHFVLILFSRKNFKQMKRVWQFLSSQKTSSRQRLRNTGKAAFASLKSVLCKQLIQKMV